MCIDVLLFMFKHAMKMYLCVLFVAAEYKWTKFDVIYYEYGSLILLYHSAEAAAHAYNILKEATFDDKQLLVLLLPHIQVHCHCLNLVALVLWQQLAGTAIPVMILPAR